MTCNKIPIARKDNTCVYSRMYFRIKSRYTFIVSISRSNSVENCSVVSLQNDQYWWSVLLLIVMLLQGKKGKKNERYIAAREILCGCNVSIYLLFLHHYKVSWKTNRKISQREHEKKERSIFNQPGTCLLPPPSVLVSVRVS